MDGFVEVLTALQNPDNNIRNQAEKSYESTNLGTKVDYLTQILCSDCPDEIVLIACIYLRKLLSNSDLISGFKENPSQFNEFKRKIIEIIKRHALKSNLHQKLASLLCDTFMLESGDWKESQELLLELNSQQATLPVALYCVITFPGLVEQLGHGKVVNIIARSFDLNDIKISTLAARATCAYLTDREPEDIEAIMGFGALLNNVMQVIVKSVVDEDDDSVIKQFIDVVESEPLEPLLKNGFNDIITLSLQIIANDDVSCDNKQLALELIVSLTETFPGLIRKLATKAAQTNSQDPIKGAIEACLHFIQQIDDDSDDWLQIDEEEDQDLKSNALSGEASLDRLASALRGGTILPRLTTLLPALMSSPDWKARHAGLIAISAIAEGCNSQMAKILPDITKQAVLFAKDSHGRVRYAAANCMGQLAVDFDEKFCKKFHQLVIPQLVNLLDDPSGPRVIGQAASALVHFLESLPVSIMKKYVSQMVSKIEENMNREVGLGRKFTLQQLVTLLAALAGQLDEDFVEYYERFMPGLMGMMESTVSNNDFSKLRGKCIECFSIIGLAIGKEKFAPYAQKSMDMMLQLQLTPEMWEEEDETISYVISAWARIAKTLGEDFARYIPTVMEPLLKACAIKPEIQVVDEDQQNELDEDKWETLRLPNDTAQLGIKTTGLELKATAASMLVCYVREVGKSNEFAPFIERVLECSKSMLEFYFHEDVRIHAAEILEGIVKHHGLPAWKNGICSAFIASLENEPDEQVLPELMSSFATSIEHLIDHPSEIFTVEEERKVFDIIGTHLKAHLEKGYERAQKKAQTNLDDGDEEELIEAAEDDEYTLNKIADIFHAVIGVQKEYSLQFYDTVHQYFVRLIDPSSTATDRQWAYCVFDDIIEHCGKESLRYADTFLSPLINDLCHPIGELRQATAYGVGVLAKASAENKLFGSAYDGALNTASQNLKKSIDEGIKQRKQDDIANKENDEDFVGDFEVDPWENSVSAFGKILRYRSDILTMEDWFNCWINWLDEAGGICSDNEEAVATMAWLNELVSSNNEFILANLTIYVSLVGDMLISGIMDDEGVDEKNKSLEILRNMINQNAEGFNQIIASWNDHKKCLLQDALNA